MVQIKHMDMNYPNLFQVKPPKISVINENGAGDAMAGNYIYCRYKNLSLEKSLIIRCGNWNYTC